MTPTEFAERRLLPLVMMFAAGLLAGLEVSAAGERRAHAIAVQAVAVAQVYAEQCGPVWPPEQIPEIQPLARRN
ncbi:MAG: hypothetical protein ACK4KV_09445 [Rhodocyclaceae bacterium]